MLIVSPFLPYPIDSGGRTRLFNLIKEGSQCFELHFLFVNESKQAVSLEECQSALPRVVFHQVLVDGSRPVRLFRCLLRILGGQGFCYSSIKKVIADLVNKNGIDIVQFEFSQTIRYCSQHLKAKKVLVIHEIIFRSLLRQLSIKSGLKERLLNFGRFLLFRREEVAAIRAFDLVITMSNEDRLYLAKFTTRQNIEVIPNGVNTDNFVYPEYIQPGHQAYFIGWFKNLQNLDAINFFLDELLPACLKKAISFKMKVIGKDASSSLQKRLSDLGFDYIEYLPEKDMLTVLRNSILIVPLRFGGGTRLKILEAMALGNPVISSPIGAEGLDLKDGRDILIYEDKEAFVEKLSQLLSSDSLWSSLVRSAREQVVANYDWQVIVKNSLSYYQRLID